MKKVLVFVLYDKDIILATPSAYACLNRVFTSFSEDYVPYTPVRFDVI